MPSTVVIGFLGTTLDAGSGADRWNRWRPTVDLCRHDDFLVDRLELLCHSKGMRLAERVIKDIGTISPETEVRIQEIDFDNAWDFEEVYAGLHDFARAYPFDPEREDYLVQHDHRDPRRADLPVPAHRVAAPAGAAAADLSASEATASRATPGRAIGIIDLDLSKLRRAWPPASRRRWTRRAVSFLKSGIETRNRDFNTADRTHREAWPSPPRRRSCSPGRPGPGSRNWPGGSTSCGSSGATRWPATSWR